MTETLVQLERLALPNLNQRQEHLAAGVRASLLGRTRPFLIVSQTANRRLKPYRMYVNVRDYGETLQTSWFLAYQPRPWQRLRDRSVLGLDLFDEQDLRAYVTAVHRCFLTAVIDLLVALDQDTSRIERTSKGFLGIS